MAQGPRGARQRRRLSLSIRLSLLALCAAVLPLAAVVGFTNYLARNTLIQQGRASLSTDATAKTAQVDAYLGERSLDGAALASLPTAQLYLACKQEPAILKQLPASLAPFAPVLTGILQCDTQGQSYEDSVKRALNVGIVRDSNYAVWSVVDAQANGLLSTAAAAQAVPQEDLGALRQGKQYISGVHDNASSNSAYVYLYTPIKLSMSGLADEIQTLAQAAQAGKAGQGAPGGGSGLAALGPQQVAALVKAMQGIPDPMVGFLQATLKLDYIWNIVGGELGANGHGSYAYIADQNGVRVADAVASERFTAIAPLDSATAQRYGTGAAVPTTSLPSVAGALRGTATESSFQSAAVPGSQTPYQYVAIHMKTMPWTYFVLSPLSTVTRVADDQVRASLLAAAVVAVLAALLGLMIGTRMADPVQRSVADLRMATESLNALAAKQENSAGEQQWVVEACKTGLDSVRYLSDAMHQAAHRIVDASDWFSQYWDRLTEEQAQRTVQHLRELAQYIDEAARRQWTSSERLDKAITVTTQVSDQLAGGATAAAESAEQLDDVVAQLQGVVGGRPRGAEVYRDADQERDEPQHDLDDRVAPRAEMEPRGRVPSMHLNGNGGNGGYGGYAPSPAMQAPMAAPMGAPRGQRMLAGAPMGGNPRGGNAMGGPAMGQAQGGWPGGPWQGAGPMSPPMGQYNQQPGDWEEGYGPRGGAGQPEYAGRAGAAAGGHGQPGRNLPATWQEAAGGPEVRVWQER